MKKLTFAIHIDVETSDDAIAELIKAMLIYKTSDIPFDWRIEQWLKSGELRNISMEYTVIQQVKEKQQIGSTKSGPD